MRSKGQVIALGRDIYIFGGNRHTQRMYLTFAWCAAVVQGMVPGGLE